VSDFTFAGEHSSTYHVRLLRSPVSVLPGTRDKVITLPGRHGAIRMLPDFGERTLTLDCWLAASSMTELQARLTNVRAWLSPLRGVQRLLFDSIPDRFYLAAYAGGGIDASIVSRQARFTITFVCSDPFVYALNPDVVTLAASPHTLSQRGTVPADPLLRLQGGSSGLGGQQIIIAVGAQAILYRGVLALGEWLEFDCAAKTATRVEGASRTNVLPQLDKPIFPQLLPGANRITVLPSGGASWSVLELHCRNRWL